MAGPGCSPYRTRALLAPEARGERVRADPFVTCVLLGVLACSLVRVAFLACGSERFGRDVVLAPLASVVAGYYLVRLRKS
jgi:hypothetical protein